MTNNPKKKLLIIESDSEPSISSAVSEHNTSTNDKDDIPSEKSITEDSISESSSNSSSSNSSSSNSSSSNSSSEDRKSVV